METSLFKAHLDTAHLALIRSNLAALFFEHFAFRLQSFGSLAARIIHKAGAQGERFPWAGTAPTELFALCRSDRYSRDCRVVWSTLRAFLCRILWHPLCSDRNHGEAKKSGGGSSVFVIAGLRGHRYARRAQNARQPGTQSARPASLLKRCRDGRLDCLEPGGGRGVARGSDISQPLARLAISPTGETFRRLYPRLSGS